MILFRLFDTVCTECVKWPIEFISFLFLSPASFLSSTVTLHSVNLVFLHLFPSRRYFLSSLSSSVYARGLFVNSLNVFQSCITSSVSLMPSVPFIYPLEPVVADLTLGWKFVLKSVIVHHDYTYVWPKNLALLFPLSYPTVFCFLRSSLFLCLKSSVSSQFFNVPRFSQKHSFFLFITHDFKDNLKKQLCA